MRFHTAKDKSHYEASRSHQQVLRRQREVSITHREVIYNRQRHRMWCQHTGRSRHYVPRWITPPKFLEKSTLLPYFWTEVRGVSLVHIYLFILFKYVPQLHGYKSVVESVCHQSCLFSFNICHVTLIYRIRVALETARDNPRLGQIRWFLPCFHFIIQ